RSRADLEAVGGRRYAKDSSTELLTVVALLPGRAVIWTPLLTTPLPAAGLWPQGYEACGVPERPVESFAGPALPAPVVTALAAGHPLCAHNALASTPWSGGPGACPNPPPGWTPCPRPGRPACPVSSTRSGSGWSAWAST